MGPNVSLDLALPLKLFEQPLHDSIHELHQGYQSLSDCVDQAMAECEQRGTELAECRSQLAEARRGLLEQEKELAERTRAEADATRSLGELKPRLEATLAELAEANEKLTHAQSDELQSGLRLEVQLERDQQLQAQIEQLQNEGNQSRDELAQLRVQFGPLTEATVEAARLRGELGTAQVELNTLRDQLAANSQQPDVEEQLAAALAERQQAESELDQLRRRAAELAETLAEQKRVVAEQREQWSEELRLLRRAVDRQSELLVHHPGPAGNAADAQPSAPADASESRPTSPVKNDQVVDSVVQQFEMLQKSKVRKKAKSAK